MNVKTKEGLVEYLEKYALRLSEMEKTSQFDEADRRWEISNNLLTALARTAGFKNTYEAALKLIESVDGIVANHALALLCTPQALGWILANTIYPTRILARCNTFLQTENPLGRGAAPYNVTWSANFIGMLSGVCREACLDELANFPMQVLNSNLVRPGILERLVQSAQMTDMAGTWLSKNVNMFMPKSHE